MIFFSKDQILSLVPARQGFWKLIYTAVDQHYPFILLLIVAIVVMSNPYIGFGRLVLHIFTGLLYTLVLVKAILWTYESFKNITSSIFFYTDEETVKERFAYSKSTYGLFIIISFLMFILVGFIIAARIWGWSIALTDVYEWIEKPLMFKGTENPFTVLSLLQIVGFLVGGFLIAFVIEHVVFHRLFEVLLVDSGIQNTVLRLSRYLIVITALILAFQTTGLGALVAYLIGALILSIGWVIKEPVSDLIAYFIILVQRPIKIGDYVQLDEETIGIVRKITARAVIVRRKNSVTMIVPNSQVINKTVINWNYTEGFIAFNDINVTVAYKEDPARVHALLLAVAGQHPNVLKNPKPIVRLNEFGEYGYVFMVRGFISSVHTLEMLDIASDVRLAIMKAFSAENIAIALPVWLTASDEGIGQEVRYPVKRAQ